MNVKAKPRCYRCRYPIPGEPYRADTKEFCSKSCSEFHILSVITRSRGAAHFRSPWYIVVAIIAALFAISVFQGPARAHDIYNDWLIPGQSKSCCNMQDCKVTQAKFERNAWWAFVSSKRIWVKVPDERIVNYKTDDTEAHLCYSESWSEVYCFRPPKLGM